MENSERYQKRHTNMNELKILIQGGSYIYYKTDYDKCWDAFHDFQEKIRELGINIDNVKIIEMVLRDEEYDDIDLVEF